MDVLCFCTCHSLWEKTNSLPCFAPLYMAMRKYLYSMASMGKGIVFRLKTLYKDLS